MGNSDHGTPYVHSIESRWPWTLSLDPHDMEKGAQVVWGKGSESSETGDYEAVRAF